MALRKGDYKYVYAEQRLAGTMGVWAEPFTKLRLQKIFNLFQDPFERADITSNTFWDWQLNHVGQVYGAMDDVVAFVVTFKEFPPRSFPPSFVPTTIMEETMDDIKDAEAEGRAAGPKHRQDPLGREPDDRAATPAARDQVGRGVNSGSLAGGPDYVALLRSTPELPDDQWKSPAVRPVK